jgi:hypothetical protein
MLKLFLFFGLGVLVGGAACWLFLSQHSQYGLGVRYGEIRAKLDFVQAVKALGNDYHRSDGYNTAVEVKDIAVVTVERNGVKTLSVYRPGAQ